MLCHSTGWLRNRGGAGDFHRPYETLRTLHSTIQRMTLPQSRPFGRDSSLREGAGKRSHSTGYSLESQVTGDFHRPYETQKTLHFSIHRGQKMKKPSPGCGLGGGFFGHGGWECLKNGQMWGGDWNSGSEGGSVRGKWAGDGVCYCQ